MEKKSGRKKIKIEIHNKSKKDDMKQDYLNKLYEAYNREISNLWQRSIFLGTFLLAIFAAYGKCWELALNAGKMNIGAFRSFSIGFIVVSFLGIVFSILWIMMAKGSKAWQEVYELKIRTFEKEKRVYDSLFVGDDYFTKTGIEPTVLGRINRSRIEENLQYSPKLSRCLFSGSGGPYSVGKINIFIGTVFLFFWSCSFLFHSFSLSVSDGIYFKYNISVMKWIERIFQT